MDNSQDIVKAKLENTTSIFSKDNLVAWCIVPFDASKRGPKERAEMLERLGLKSLAYDWREEHVPTFDEEVVQLRKHGIRMVAFWWAAGWPDNPNESPRARRNLEFFKRNNLKLDVWATSHAPEELSTDEEKYEFAARCADILATELDKLDCRLSLYNHGGWGGEPRNMVEIVKRVKSKNVGIVYNFHHGHEHLDDMPEAFYAMLPYLTCVNLNGMTKGGPKILPLGQGEEDLKILKMIRDSGYKGPIGILDERSYLDAELSLRENLDGLKNLLKELGDDAALKTY